MTYEYIYTNWIISRYRRMSEYWRSEWTPLRREYHGLREHAGIIFMSVQPRVHATE